MGEVALVAIQFTTRAAIGAIAYESGGLVVDGGWIRLLGAGGPRMSASLVTINQLDRPSSEIIQTIGLVVAIDVLGGVFALNTGLLPGADGGVCYLHPRTLTWAELAPG